MKHKHADVLMAIAENAEAIHDFEVFQEGWDLDAIWDPLTEWQGWLYYPTKWKVRRKQKTIKVNGFDVPEPCREMPAKYTRYYVPQFGEEELFMSINNNDDNYDRRALKRGLVHLTKEAAVAHAKAMLGIDPSTE